MNKKLITVALPYVNNIPHLGNIIQVLSGDVYARFCKNMGYETIFICGTDEYGTATENRALKEGISPKELCDRYYKEHKEIYEWFNIEFSHFGRTSKDVQTKIVQDIYKEVEKNGYIVEHEIEQLFCEICDRFLADRFVHGECPECGYADARGDQCDKCGKLLDPTDLKNPRCEICNNSPQLKSTKHLYLDLPKLKDELENWVNKTSNNWSNNALMITKSWIRDGLKERCITRDLKWGISVPKAGFENKVFYVWFDAPIGYISITADLLGDDYKTWWCNPDNVDLVQFIGKDNIPFHTVMFPCSLIATKQNWTMLKYMSSSEYLNYENTKFSKSRNIGVFGNDCKDTGIASDIWRFFLYYNRPEKSDSQFIWREFLERVNGELIGNLSNFINRTLAFTHKFYDGQVPNGLKDEKLWQEVLLLENKFKSQMDKIEIKESVKTLLEISDLGNKYFQAGEPWKYRTEDPKKAENLIFNLLYLVRDVAMLMEIYMPEASKKALTMLNVKQDWSNLGRLEGLSNLAESTILFNMLDKDFIESLRIKFAGEETVSNQSTSQPNPTTNQADTLSFNQMIDLRVANIKAIERHPDGDKLYILKLDLAGEERQIVSSIVPYYTESELLGKNIVIVYNLKKAKFRGVMSEGMLLAADAGDDIDDCEVLFTDASSGTRFTLEGDEIVDAKTNISIDKFSAYPMHTVNGIAHCNGKKLINASHTLKSIKYINNKIG